MTFHVIFPITMIFFTLYLYLLLLLLILNLEQGRRRFLSGALKNDKIKSHRLISVNTKSTINFSKGKVKVFAMEYPDFSRYKCFTVITLSSLHGSHSWVLAQYMLLCNATCYLFATEILMLLY